MSRPIVPDPLSDSVVRSDQLLRETSGTDSEIGLKMTSLVRSIRFPYRLTGSQD